MWKWCLKASNHYLSKAFSKFFFPVTVYGMENYPQKDEAVLLALNHESKADSFLVLLALEEYFGSQIDLRAFVTALHMDSFYGWWLYGQGMVRVERGEGFEQLKEGIDFIRKGGQIAIFPEGRMRRGRSLPAKKGVSYIVHHTGVSVLPIHIEYVPSRYIWYRKCIITIGESISQEVGEEDFQMFADKVMTTIDSLPHTRHTYQKIFQHS